MRLTLLWMLTTGAFALFGQEETVGLLYHGEQTAPGYTLFSPNSSRDAFLIDNCGFVLHKWENAGFPELTSYLLEDGSLLRASWGFIEKRNWEGERTWFYELEEFGDNHHDFEPLPNGNVLVILTEYKSRNEAIVRGRNPELVEEEFGVDAIYEIQPTGPNSGEVVWKWSFWDHLVQDISPARQNFGVVANNPGKLDVNFNDLGEPYDWLHCNGVDYNAELDQILISSRHTSELYIIDHSTTTAEAQGSTGGQAGKGGDFLWRWGNRKVYGRGDYVDQQLFQQHHASWIPAGFPDEGKITVFNNLAEFDFEGNAEFSQIHILDPRVTSDGTYNRNAQGIFWPADFDWTYTGKVLGNNFWSPIESGVQMLPNGNMLACLAVGGRFVEVTREGEVVWVYQNPVSFEPVDQKDDLTGFFDVFRAERYPPDYPAFKDRDLTPQGLIEDQNSISVSCSLVSSTSEWGLSVFSIYPNPVRNFLNITFDGRPVGKIDLRLFSMDGRPVAQLVPSSISGSSLRVEVGDLPAGVYLLQIDYEGGRSGFRVLVL